MFFCNPWHHHGKDDTDRLLEDNDKLSWLSPSFDSATTPGLESMASSCLEDLDSSSRSFFSDAPAFDAIFRKGSFRKTKRRKHRMTLGMFLFLGLFWYCHSYSNNTIATADTLIWIKSSAVRIWNGVPCLIVMNERMMLVLELSNKIDNAILSLFRWDDVDDAIVERIKKAILFMGKLMMDYTRERLP